jgi:hypothetical protein
VVRSARAHLQQPRPASAALPPVRSCRASSTPSPPPRAGGLLPEDQHLGQDPPELEAALTPCPGNQEVPATSRPPSPAHEMKRLVRSAAKLMTLAATLQGAGVLPELLTGIYHPPRHELHAVRRLRRGRLTRPRLHPGQDPRRPTRRGQPQQHGGRPQVIDDDTLVFARPLRDTGVPISEIAKNSPSRPASTPRSPPCTGHWLITPSPSSRRPVLPNDDEPCRYGRASDINGESPSPRPRRPINAPCMPEACRHGSLSLGRKVRSCSTADPYVRGVLTAAMRRGRLRRGDLSSFECQVFGAE